MQTNTVVAIKERISDRESFVFAWKQEINSLKMIENKIPSFFTPKLICVLDDSSRSLKEKYLVLEWIGNIFFFIFNYFLFFFIFVYFYLF